MNTLDHQSSDAYVSRNLKIGLIVSTRTSGASKVRGGEPEVASSNSLKVASIFVWN